MDQTRLQTHLRHFGQEHVLQWWDSLSSVQQLQLKEQIESIDLRQLTQLQKSPKIGRAHQLPADIKPVSALCLPSDAKEQTHWNDATWRGKKYLAEGKTAVLLVAGGQGSRLGFPKPKGMFPIGPVTGKSLFQIHAEKVLALTRRYNTTIPYLVTTSDTTHDTIEQFFRENQWFGLNKEHVFLFCQPSFPTVDLDNGKLLLQTKHCLAMSPDGHGGILQGLFQAGIFDQLQSQGIELLFFHQVDNPLVQVCDASFVGLHLMENAEVSTKTVRKQQASDRVGLIAQSDRNMVIIEYSDLPEAIANQHDQEGQLQFWTGNTAIHLFQLAFLNRVSKTGNPLPYHSAYKKVDHVDASGKMCRPSQPNAMKFEQFIFDILPQAERWLVVETKRKNEYAPLKNAHGDHSPESVQRALSQLYISWMKKTGTPIPELLTEAFQLEISPLFASDLEELSLQNISAIRVDAPLYLSAR